MPSILALLRVGSIFLSSALFRAFVAAVVVGRVRLDRDLRRVSVLLGLRVAGLFFLVEESGQRDRGQDSEDEHDDEELDQREAGLAVAVEPGANLGPEILEKH